MRPESGARMTERFWGDMNSTRRARILVPLQHLQPAARVQFGQGTSTMFLVSTSNPAGGMQLGTGTLFLRAAAL